MAGSTKLMTAGGGGVSIVPASSIAADVTVNVPSQNCTLGIQGPAFSVYQSSGQNIASGIYTKVQFQTKEYDTANCFDAVTNYRFTPNVAGYYSFKSIVTGGSATWVNGFANLFIYKNGSVVKGSASTQPTNGNYVSSYAISDVYMNGSTDYVEVYVLYGGNSAAVPTINTSTYTYFQGFLARAV